MPEWIPDGWHCVTPRLVSEDPRRLVQFLKDVFDAEGEFGDDRPAQMRIGDSIVLVGDAKVRRAVPGFLYVYVKDADATYERAMRGGSISLEEPEDMPYGDRRAMIRDPFGNDWQIATYKGRRE